MSINTGSVCQMKAAGKQWGMATLYKAHTDTICYHAAAYHKGQRWIPKTENIKKAATFAGFGMPPMASPALNSAPMKIIVNDRSILSSRQPVCRMT